VEQVCTHVGVISRGRLICVGQVQDLLNMSRQRVRIEVDAPARALEIVRRLDFCEEPIMDPTGLEVTTTREHTAQLNALLIQSGLSVFALVPQRRSLEDLYLQVMQDDETADNSAA
jgi:ABC-2 type transport system ATP-binding protein